MFKIIASLLFFSILISCSDEKHSISRKDYLARVVWEHPVRRIDYWQLHHSSATKFSELGSTSTNYILQFLNYDKEFHNFDSSKVKYFREGKDKVKKVLIEMDKNLPKCMKEGFLKHVTSIIAVSDLGSLGLSASVWDGERFSSSFVAVDAQKLLEAVNPLGYRTAKAFKDLSDKDFFFSYNKNESIAFLLLHEFAHAYATANEGYPNLIYPSTSDGTFESISWLKKEDGFIRKKEQATLNISFYEKDKNEINNAEVFYKHFNKSNFPSLYALQSVHEDWAETFAIMAMKRFYGKEHFYIIRKKKVRSCLFRGTCEKKRKYMDAVLNQICPRT